MIILTNWDCCEGRHNGLHFWPKDVGKENSLIIRIKFVPGNTSMNLSASGEFKCIGASGAITYLFVEHIGNITVAFAQYTKCAVNSKTYKRILLKYKNGGSGGRNTCARVISASAARVCRFFNGEYSDNSLSNDGEPSKVTKSVNCVTGYNNSKLW